EGLAEYVSENGKNRVRQAAEQVGKSRAERLLYPLDGPYSAFGYPQYYLAVEYISEKHTSNSIHGIVRDLIAGKSLNESIDDNLTMSWEKFQQNVREYSLNAFREAAGSHF